MPSHFTEVNRKGKRFPAINASPASTAPMPPKSQSVQQARDNFVRWLRWYWETHSDTIPTQGSFAKQLGITAGALTQLLAEGSTRSPQFKTLVGARNLTGMPIDALMFSPAPTR